MNAQKIFWRVISLRKPSEEEERRKNLKKRWDFTSETLEKDHICQALTRSDFYGWVLNFLILSL